MIAVIFEVVLKEANDPRYFDLAAALREELQEVEGFISVERFKSLTSEGKYLSLSIWRDQEAVADWFGRPRHRAAQEEGRRDIFRDYRIRVAEVLRDYDLAGGRPDV